MVRVVKTWIAVAAATCAVGCANGGSGLSSPSPLAVATPSVPSSCAVPGAPHDVSADVTGSSVRLAWSAVGEASDYVVLVGSTPTSSETVFTNTVDVQHSIDGLAAGTHFARVLAHNWCGTSDSSGSVSFRVD